MKICWIMCLVSFVLESKLSALVCYIFAFLSFTIFYPLYFCCPTTLFSIFLLPKCSPNVRATNLGNKLAKSCYIQLHRATCSYSQRQTATMSSNIKLQKSCHQCGNQFTAKTTVTKFCSDDCAKRAYKIRKREEKIQSAIQLEAVRKTYDPVISEKEFLTIDEACQLVNASRWTIYRLIERGELRAGKLGRRTRIPRNAIDELLKLNES